MRTAGATVKMIFSAALNNALEAGGSATSAIGGQIINQALTNGVQVNNVNRALHIPELSLPEATLYGGLPGLEENSSTGHVDYDITRFDNVDVGAGLGKDMVGESVDFEEIVFLLIRNLEKSPGNVVINPTRGTASIPWIQTAFPSPGYQGGSQVLESNVIRPGAFKFWFYPSEQGLDVTNGSVSNFRLAGDAGLTLGDPGAAFAQILILGRSSDSLDLEFVPSVGSEDLTARVALDGKIWIVNSTGSDIGLSGCTFNSPGNHLIQVPPGDLTGDSSPFSFMIANETNQISYGNLGSEVNVPANDEIETTAFYVIA